MKKYLVTLPITGNSLRRGRSRHGARGPKRAKHECSFDDIEFDCYTNDITTPDGNTKHV